MTEVSNKSIGKYCQFIINYWATIITYIPPRISGDRPHVPPNFSGYASMPTGWGNSKSTVTVLPSTTVFFHGTYRGAQSVVPPNTNSIHSDISTDHYECIALCEASIPQRRLILGVISCLQQIHIEGQVNGDILEPDEVRSPIRSSPELWCGLKEYLVHICFPSIRATCQNSEKRDFILEESEVCSVMQQTSAFTQGTEIKITATAVLICQNHFT